MATQHIQHKGEDFYFLRNQGNYRVFYNNRNVFGDSKVGVYYIASHKETGKIVEWCSLGKGELKKFLEWLVFLELPWEA